MGGAGALRGSTHLLLEAVGDLQLHQQDAPPHVQLLVQVLEVGVDVLLHGRSLVGQLLEDLPDQVQGLGDLGQPGTQVGRAGCVAVTTEGPTPDADGGARAGSTCHSPALHRGQRPPQAAALLLQALLQGQRGVVLVVWNTVLTQRTGTGGAVQVGYLGRAQSRSRLETVPPPPTNDVPHTHLGCMLQTGVFGGRSLQDGALLTAAVWGMLARLHLDTPPYSKAGPAQGRVDTRTALGSGKTTVSVSDGGHPPTARRPRPLLTDGFHGNGAASSMAGSTGSNRWPHSHREVSNR